MAIRTHERLKFSSRPYHRRVALLPTSLSLAVAWLFLASWLTLAFYMMPIIPLWSCMAMLTVAALSPFLFVFSYQRIKDAFDTYELELGGEQVKLSLFNRAGELKKKQTFYLKEIRRAEYYQTRDTASIVLRTVTDDMDIPLWSFGPDAERQIVEFVRTRGIKTVGIPNDVVY